MNSSANSARNFRLLSGLLWLSVPAEAALCAVSWHQLPDRLATHFDFQNRPNGWMSRPAWLTFSLTITMLLAATASWILRRIGKPGVAAWGLLAVFYLVLGTLVWATDSVIDFNVHGRPINVMPVVAASLASAIVVVVLALATRRGTKLSAPTVFADEVHQSALWGIVLATPSVAFAVLASKLPLLGLRVAIGLAIAMLLAGAALAWSGFHYIFSPAGVEIRTLGFRLRSIPAYGIRTYAVDRWNALGGYGIRGVGRGRAYVWGNRGVRIQTTEGEVFLGHSQPEKLMRDLDLVVRDGATHDDKF